VSPAPAQIGAYTIERELGRGGMGVVYLGHDPRLDRKVAIKALPEDLADDPERLARLEREAKTLASLNHPNVAGIYGVEEHDGGQYLVLEFVEGETLAGRLDRGSLPVDEAIDIAVQIAAGVEAAHDAGVVHRDLKPGNVIVTPDGQAKVLDFGLARVDEAGAPASGSSMSPTLTSPAQHSPTIPGVILGTAAYMSPEQARGRPVDKRTDIWSFGVVLFEMLTGLRPFHGETVSDSIGAILHKPLDLDRLPPAAPPRVRRVIERCRVRDRRERLRDIGDARLELSTSDALPDPERSASGRLGVAAALIVAIVALGVGLLGGRQLAPSGEARLEGPLHIAIPTNTAGYIDRDPDTPSFDIAPDGSAIAYIGVEDMGSEASRTAVVYLRRLDSAEARRLRGTEHARSVSFSPSGRQLAVTLSAPEAQGERIVRLTVDGGPALPMIVDDGGAWNSRGATPWLDEETIVVSSSDLLRLYRVDVSDRRPQLIVDLSEALPDLIFAAQAHSVGDGRHVLFWGVRRREGLEPEAAIYHLDAETGEVRMALDNAAGGVVMRESGHIVFTRADTLCVAPIDLSSFEVGGPIVAVMPDHAGETYRVSNKGDIIYSSTRSEPARRRIMTVDRGGNLEPLVGLQRDFGAELRVSPEGDRVAVTLANPNPVVHVIDIATGFMRPVTRSDEAAIEPMWTPDGRIVYNRIQSLRDQRHYVVDIDGDGDATPLVTGAAESWWSENVSFTPDGAFAVMLRRSGRDASGDLYLVDLSGSAEPLPVVDSATSEMGPALSPDGTLLAYLTDVSGVPTVSVQPFDPDDPSAPQRARIVSQMESTGVFWSPSGDEVFWVERRYGEWAALMGATVSMEDGLAVGPPTEIVSRADAPFHITYGSLPVHIMPDGERFVFVEDAAEQQRPTHLNLILNWADEVSERIAAAAD
jgi:serine/threonine-protein kinase